MLVIESETLTVHNNAIADSLLTVQEQIQMRASRLAVRNIYCSSLNILGA